VRSVKRNHFLPRLVVAGCAGALLLGTAAGCETTQDKAKAHQEEAERILEARAKRQAAKKKDKQKDGKGNKPSENGGKKQ
jgi:hypothetical protein